MKTHESVADYLNEIIEIARFAPSVHNSQPWRVSGINNEIKIGIDSSHQLNQGDPTGRQTFISLGIFCEAIFQGASNFGFSPKHIVVSASGAEISFRKSDYTNVIKDFSLLITTRSSDRSIYSPLNKKVIDNISLEKANNDKKIEIRFVTNKERINKIAHLTSKGINLALNNPEFRKELKKYLILPLSNKKRGIAVKSLYINPILELLQPYFMQFGFGIKGEVNNEYRRWQSASAIFVFLSDGDLREDWYRIGRSYLRISLYIESLGLSQATSAALVEASDYHEDLESMLHTNKRVQAVIRIGIGAKKKYHSPRASTIELLT